ncbi:MAG: TonB-dependent receptor, partial [Bacteroidota bacterium]
MSRSLWAISLALLFHVTLFSQTVVGSVISADDDTDLSGVAIQVVGTSSGTTSDKDGRFTLGLPDFGRYQIRFSYLGYAPQTFTVEALLTQPTVPLAIAMTTQAFTTEALTVSATRADAKTPVTYVNLSQEDIAVNNLGQDLPFLLKWTPSVVVTSDAGAGIGYTGIWIRGSDPTRTNVTINGIPLNDSESQGVFWVNLPDFASSASDIQIQRGVGTSTNGAGAFGASININTNQLNEIAYGSLEGGIGSFGTRRANLRFGTGLLNNGFSVDGRLSRIHSDGYIDRARADLDGYYLSAAHTGEKSVLRFNLFGGHEVTYQAWNGVDATLVDDRDTRTANTAGTAREGEPYENEVDDYEQTHYQLHYAT